MQTGKSFLIALALLPVATRTAQAQDLKSAGAFIRGLYASYKEGGRPVDLAGPKAGTILAPSLVSLLRTDRKVLHDEVGVLDGDPICACQDFDIRSVRVAVTADGDQKARATARFDNLGAATEVRFDLVLMKSGWRIFNIHEKNLPDLRKALEEEIASTTRARKRSR
jgi:hypothetical protein